MTVLHFGLFDHKPVTLPNAGLGRWHRKGRKRVVLWRVTQHVESFGQIETLEPIVEMPCATKAPSISALIAQSISCVASR